MNINHRLLPTALSLIVALLALTSALSARATALNLAMQPLFSGAGGAPNILMAIDDSGSMDFETLFPTDQGLLYWDDTTQSTWESGNSAFITSSNGNSNAAYAYLFPNGFDDCTTSDCAPQDRRLYHRYYAVPPIPQMAFARDPEYNKAYFNPAVTYAPWSTDAAGVAMPQSDPAAAYYDPTVKSATLDLTHEYTSDAAGETFNLRAGMVIPAGTAYYNDATGSPPAAASDFSTKDTAYTVPETGAGEYGVAYFPATFYLKKTTALPTDYGYSATPLTATAPNGDSLLGYEIKPVNFSSTAAYDAAIHNFANWFTYYRKRQLALRGGISIALDQIDSAGVGARVGMCPMSQVTDSSTSLVMQDLSSATNRQTFYSNLFGLDFSHPNDTPGRKALLFLAQQLEDNPSIVTSPCQQNFVMLVTDGYNDEPLPTGDASGVGQRDGSDGSNTMADVASKYYSLLGHDSSTYLGEKLQKGNFSGQVPVSPRCDAASPDPSLDCNKDPHLVTFGVTLFPTTPSQQSPLFTGTGYPNLSIDAYRNPPTWPNPIHSSTPSPSAEAQTSNLTDGVDPSVGGFGGEQIYDLWHATVNSHGEMLDANTPAAIANAFTSALNNIVYTRGSASGLATNSASLTAQTVAYQASFTDGSWQGELAAYPLLNGISENQSIWRASVLLTDQDPATRVILTDLPQSNGTLMPSAFTYTDLQNSTDSKLLAQAQVSYLRGVRSDEASNTGSSQGSSKNTSKSGLRNRGANILGDIVHSDPRYVGPPARYRYPKTWQDLRDSGASLPENNASAQTYGAFIQAHADRTPMVYVGANDGMLHGFSALDGTEKLAYVPSAVIPNLPTLTDPSYVHQYYVDGSPATGDVFYNGSWHTVLVGGLGDGGRSIYALDITAPSNFSQASPESTVLWEFTDSELGKTFGKPSIVRLHNGHWAAMFANGYNSTSEGASLYLVDIQNGTLIKRIATGAKPGNINNDPGNGLSAPFPVDADGDFTTDYAYAGDLYGNLWKFDLTSADPASWSATKLFQARSPGGTAQPITTQPQVGVHPYGLAYGVMVYFGTGKYLENADAQLDPSLQNSFYGIWDPNVFTARSDFAATLPIDRSELAAQSVMSVTDSSGDIYRVVSDNPVNYQSSDSQTPVDRGWVLDLPAGTGELIVSNSQLQGKTVSFSTIIANRKACKATNTGFFMVLDSATGGQTSFTAIDLNGDYQFNAQDMVTVDSQPANVSGVPLTSGAPGAATYSVDRAHEDDVVNLPDSHAGTTRINVNIGLPPDGRRSWREIRR